MGLPCSWFGVFAKPTSSHSPNLRVYTTGLRNDLSEQSFIEGQWTNVAPTAGLEDLGTTNNCRCKASKKTFGHTLFPEFALELSTRKPDYTMEQSLTNPVIPGFAPDPSLVYVDGTYFLVNSSFHMFPGLPVYASKDLKDWKHIGMPLLSPFEASP